MAEQTSKVKLIIDTEGANTSLRDMQKVARELRNELSKINDKNGPEYDEKVKQYNTVNNLVKTQQAEIKAVGVALENNKGIFGKTFDFIKSNFVVSLTDIGNVLNFIGSGFSFAKKSFTDFEKAGQSLKSNLDLTDEALADLKNRADELGPTMGKSAAEMLDAYKLIGSGKPEIAGNTEAINEMTKSAIIFSQAAEIELTDAAESLTQSLNQFGQGADQANTFINIMAAGAQKGWTEINNIKASLKAVGPVANGANVSFAQTNGILQNFASIGLKGEQAGTMLRNVLIKLQSGAKDTNPAIVGLETALDNLSKKNMSTAATAKLFGTENIVAAQQLVSHRTEIIKFSKSLEGTDAAYKMAATNTKTWEFQLTTINNTFKSMAVSVMNFLMPAIISFTSGFITLINIVRAAPAFIKENKEMFIALGVAIISLNTGLIAATAASLYHTAVTKAQAIATAATTTAQKLLNLALSTNPIGAVVAVISLLIGGLITWYNNSEKVRAGVAGLWASVKALGTVISEAYVAFSTFNFSKVADIFKNGASQISGAFNKAYNDKLKEGHAEDKTVTKKHLDTKVTDATAAAKAAAAAAAAAQSEGLSKEQKQAADHRKKEGEERKKDEKAAQNAIDDIRIEAIKNDLSRDVERLRTKNARELDQVAQSKATDTTKAAWTLALNQKLNNDIKALEDKALKQRLDDEKKANDLIDAMFQKSATNQLEIETAKLKKKYADNINTINQLQLSEARKNELILNLDKNYILANEVLQKEHQAKVLKDATQIQQTKIKSEYEANKAINDSEFLLAGNNIEKLRLAKVRGLQIEYDNKVANLAREKAAELANAETTGASTDAIDKKYKALNLSAHLENEKSKKQIETDHLQARADKNKIFYDGISSLMKGDLVAFGQAMATKLGLEKSNFSAKSQMQMKDAAQVLDLASQALDYLKKKNEEKLKSSLDTLNKEYSAKKKASDDELKMITDRLKKEKDAELSKANLSAKDKEAINKKYNDAIEKARTGHDKFVEGLDKEVSAKEKKLRLESFEQQKKLNIKMAVINGAQAILMALATTPFPVSLGIAAIIAGKTIIDVNRIKNESPPQFKQGKSPNYIQNAGVVDGPSHEQGGVSLVDNQTGEIKGVVEGYEPLAVFNKTLYKNNRGIIDLLLHKSLKGDHAPIFEMGRDPYGNSSSGGNYKPGGSEPTPDPAMDSGSSDSGSAGDAGGGGSGGGAGDGISQAEVEAITAESKNLMQDIVKNTAPIAELVTIMGEVKNGINGLNSKFDAFPRELRATVSFQQTSQSNQQAQEAQNSNIMAG